MFYVEYEATHSTNNGRKTLLRPRQPWNGLSHFFISIKGAAMESLHHKPDKQKSAVKPIIILSAIASLFFLFATFLMTSIKVTEHTIECNSFFQQGVCESGYMRQKADYVDFTPFNIINLFVIPMILILFTILVIALCRSYGKFRNITLGIWYGVVVVGIIATSIIASSLGSKPQLHHGGLSQDEFNCINDNMNALEYGSDTKECIGDSADKPMGQYWED